MTTQNEDLNNINTDEYNNIPVDYDASGDYNQNNNEAIDNNTKYYQNFASKLLIAIRN